MSLIHKQNRLKARQNITRAIRAALDSRDYLEIPAPLLIRGTNPDAFLTSFEVVANDEFQGYLTTSTEFQLLRYMAAGYDKCYTLVSNFRYGDVDRTHNPEFTMLEWEALGGMDSIETDAEAIVKAAFAAALPGCDSLEYRGHKTQIINEPWERLTIREAFKKHLNLEISQDFSLESMVLEIKKTGLAVPVEFLEDRGLLFSYLIDSIQEKLGSKVPTWVCEWPIFQTSMAEPLAKNPEAAERSELYIAGLEIANGFTTVSDIEKQKMLFDEQQKTRVAEGKKEVALDNKYMADLEGKPLRAAGMAMGVDRLVMLLTGASSISEVTAFAWDEL
jgi:lysyl-tRNA synthetase class 2